MSGTGLKALFEAYKRRRVFRVTAIYVIAFWPVIQLVDILSSALAIPDSFMRFLVFVLALLGLFVCLLPVERVTAVI